MESYLGTRHLSDNHKQIHQNRVLTNIPVFAVTQHRNKYQSTLERQKLLAPPEWDLQFVATRYHPKSTHYDRSLRRNAHLHYLLPYTVHHSPFLVHVTETYT